MATVSLEGLLPDLAVECSGVTEPLALSALRGAAIEFCRKSLYWQEETDPQPVVKGVTDYDVDVSGGRQVVSVMSVNFDNRRTLLPMTLEQVERAMPRWREATGEPFGYLVTSPESIRLVPSPTQDASMTLTVAYAPSRSSNAIQTTIYDRYYETLKHGALARLKAMMGRAFYDPQAALYYTGRFNAGVNTANVERNRGFSRANLRVEPRAFV